MGTCMKRAFVLLAVLSVGVVAWGQAPPHPANAAPAAQQKPKVSPFAGYAGLWTSKFDGKVWLQLKLDLHGEQLSGSLLHPQKIDLNDNGELKSVSEEQITEAVQRCRAQSRWAAADFERSGHTRDSTAT